MKTPFIPVRPKTGQEEYFQSLEENQITICTGYAGTGKTFLALNAALKKLYSNKAGGISRIVIIRPYIQTNIGEKLGALPGNLHEKVTPYVESIKDNLRDLIDDNQEIERLIRNKIEFTVLSMCRGRSFSDCFVIVEEAQNVPLDGQAMKMLLTRVGKNCTMVIQGDIDQMDIPSEDSALPEVINVLQNVPGVGIVSMENIDCVHRSPMVRAILRAFEEHGRKNVD